jgi:DNA mismatch repair protein MutS
MADKQTPLIRQYTQIKNKYPDTVLLFRMGDFFETFNDDAVITSKVCGITLTKRNNGAAGEMPLAGFPYHQLDTYLPKLVRAGHRVAVCEQIEDPKQARGIVRRDVIEVVTPGVALYDKMLDSKRNNYIISIFLQKTKHGEFLGLAGADISTGEFFTSEIPSHQLIEVLESLAPSELLYSKSQKNDIEKKIARLSFDPSCTKLEPWIFDFEFGREALLGNFNTKSLKGFGIEDFTFGVAAAGAILHYINETQKGRLDHISKISVFSPSDFMSLDFATRRNLEITYSMSDSAKEGTLISILDKTKTPMGGRLFKKWITRPLRKLETIHSRLEAVRAFVEFGDKRKQLRAVLSEIGDVERLISKICTGRANPRDVASLKSSLAKIPAISEILGFFNLDSLNKLKNSFLSMDDVVSLIHSAIKDEPSTVIGSGNIFKEGFSQELDGYLEAKFSGKKWITGYQEKMREETGISSLKVGFNNVFGYYIEVRNTHKDKVPDSWDRKQTLSAAERYITPELKEIETKILTAEERISEVENRLFTELRAKIATRTEQIQKNAMLIATTDCLQSYATASDEYHYTEPVIDGSEIIEVEDGRHPVVERLLGIGETFTPNSTILDTENEQIHIITGPNMSGKSCYLRQVALIVLLGQIGCFVPAKKARFGIVDRIFTRVGAQDNITSGESTFLVEMQEAANILNNATRKSLILLDEVGRGTATFDGISIAWSITEYIHDHVFAKTLFATHYHELNDLANRYGRIANYKVDVIEAEDKIIFSHNVKPGASDHSFGIHVAEMAGMPAEIITRAKSILTLLEENSDSSDLTSQKPDMGRVESIKQKSEPEQLSIFELRDDAIREKIAALEVNNLAPVDALSILKKLKKEVDRKK